MTTSQRTLQEHRTSLAPRDVIARAKTYFSQRSALYAAYLEKEGDTYVTFRGQGGEEIVIAATPQEGVTLVTGSTYLFDMQISRFFASLPQVVQQ
jgi:hypothetical protein